MKIVYKKTILGKLDELIDSASGDIDYIAVSKDEMAKIIDEIYKEEVKSGNMAGTLHSIWFERGTIKEVLYQSSIILKVEE